MTLSSAGGGWPSLRVDDWEPTRRSLHMWTQIVGKVRLAHAPLLNHWWQVPLYVSPRGLTTSAIPVGTDFFDMEFDFVDHALSVRVSDGGSGPIDLRDTSVARFHERRWHARPSGRRDGISKRPNEVDPAIPFAEDTHVGYDPAAANAFWQQLVQADRVIGRVPRPVHRQGQSRALLLGFVRPGVHPILRSARAPPSRRCAELRRLGDGGGLLARAEQLRILARRRGRRGVLLLRVSRTGRVRRRRRPSRGCLLRRRAAAVPACRTRCPRRQRTQISVCMDFLEFTYGAAADLVGWDRAALEVDPGRRAG